MNHPKLRHDNSSPPCSTPFFSAVLLAASFGDHRANDRARRAVRWCWRSSARRACGCCSRPSSSHGAGLVYVGAVMVLFLFVVMMLDIDHRGTARGLRQVLPLA
jgi:hypothetical protein